MVNNTPQELLFYQNRFMGMKYNDSLCLGKRSSTCVEQFQYAFTMQLGLGKIDGIVGLSPNLTVTNNSKPFVTMLYESGVIPSQILSYYLDKKSKEAVLEFGDLDSSYMKESENDLYDSISWFTTKKEENFMITVDNACYNDGDCFL
mmetsp:Transcript_14565/g.14196  ORF Transcript_14565/g.14196 Transcript_14565/m.14196 type:complete len:147 (-) Transcript_14565:649-1089(-)